MACGSRHFEARQRPEAPECWRHFSVSEWPEGCIACIKAFLKVWAKNYSRTERQYLVNITSWMIYNHINGIPVIWIITLYISWLLLCYCSKHYIFKIYFMRVDYSFKPFSVIIFEVIIHVYTSHWLQYGQLSLFRLYPIPR